jgi:kynurenine formamidase
LTPDFPTYFGTPAFTAEDTFTWDAKKVNVKTLTCPAHLGKHSDAPIHFSEDGSTVDELPVKSLVCHLAILDVREVAAGDSDYRVTSEDITAFEAAHGPSGSLCPKDHRVGKSTNNEAHGELDSRVER